MQMDARNPPLNELPRPGKRRIAVRVAPAAERALRSGHPWLFENSIRELSHAGAAGDLAVVFDRKGRFLAVGLYDPYGPIRVRVLQHTTTALIGPDWFAARVGAAWQRRHPLWDAPARTAPTTGFRVVHGENDGLPGLVVDRYGRTLVLKLYTAAWVPHLHDVVGAVTAVVPDIERIILRLSRHVQALPDALHGLSDGTVLLGPAVRAPVIFLENGLRFEADVTAGQKTGFFLDQRDNRARVGDLAAGRTVLNVFAYTGGFSVYAARGGATRIASVDISGPALAAAQRNFALNRHIPAVARAAHTTLEGDAFALLTELGARDSRFDMVVLDPPAFAKRQDEVAGALAAYARLVGLGLGVLRRGGLLVAASCSSRVGADDFFDAVHVAARQARRPLRELARTGHALDHPVGFSEGAYLKCLFAEAG